MKSGSVAWRESPPELVQQLWKRVPECSQPKTHRRHRRSGGLGQLADGRHDPLDVLRQRRHQALLGDMGRAASPRSSQAHLFFGFGKELLDLFAAALAGSIRRSAARRARPAPGSPDPNADERPGSGPGCTAL